MFYWSCLYDGTDGLKLIFVSFSYVRVSRLIAYLWTPLLYSSGLINECVFKLCCHYLQSEYNVGIITLTDTKYYWFVPKATQLFLQKTPERSGCKVKKHETKSLKAALTNRITDWTAAWKSFECIEKVLFSPCWIILWSQIKQQTTLFFCLSVSGKLLAKTEDWSCLTD